MSLSLIEVDSGLTLLLVKVDFRPYPCFWLLPQVLSQKFRPSRKVTELEEKSNRARFTAKQKKVLEFCDKMPRTAQEILEMVKYQTKTVFQYTTKLVLMGVLRPTTTTPNDPNRKYITVHDE